MSKLFVGNLPPNSTEEEIKELFEPYGPISRLDLKGGFAFIEYQDERDADDALTKADSFSLGGNNLKVEKSRGKSFDRGDRGGDRGGRDGGGGGDRGCFKCGKTGHFARNCEEGGDDGGFRGRGGRGRGRGGGDRRGGRDGGGRGRGRGDFRGGRGGRGGRGRRDDD